MSLSLSLASCSAISASSSNASGILNAAKQLVFQAQSCLGTCTGDHVFRMFVADAVIQIFSIGQQLPRLPSLVFPLPIVWLRRLNSLSNEGLCARVQRRSKCHQINAMYLFLRHIGMKSPSSISSSSSSSSYIAYYLVTGSPAADSSPESWPSRCS